ncbi:hypothetical protein [Streptomyces yaizuensis]|uniref:Uncharacterized protein n=1 Tax=Streptomyces yaizuensis TaxID=2989713 RepID=A0AA86IWY3_9ACTN|nr:hypothetical protein [Streptomyces sp. YSPA8]BDT39568.1 hypothetical protein SYYSPA8_37250 [Streptomyces sp. YSPA8]
MQLQLEFPAGSPAAVPPGTLTPDEVAVFIASRNTRPPRTRVLWITTEEAARNLCSDPRTSSRAFMLCWTRGIGEQDIDWEWIPDTGSFDVLLRELGVTVRRSGR